MKKKNNIDMKKKNNIDTCMSTNLYFDLRSLFHKLIFTININIHKKL